MEPVSEHLDIASLDFNLITAEKFDWYAYVAYYLPILRWVPQYSRASLPGDFLAGVSLASFQIPLVMSLATSLAKLPPLVGLYSAATVALVYAFLGGVPVLVVGPLPATAVLIGQMIETVAHSGDPKLAGFLALEISSTVSVGMSGVLLATGLLRWGFLDNVLSRALLKGFIGAMGIIMIVNQLHIQLGLQDLVLKFPHTLIIDKVKFVVENAKLAHIPTLTVSVLTLTIVLMVKKMKSIAGSKYGFKSAVYIPELLAMVVVATALSYHYDWEGSGIKVVGDLNSGTSEGLEILNPFSLSRQPLLRTVFSTAFLCSILGFFDSATATKALGVKYNYNVSSNRELVALGACNLALSFFGGMPSFGALGRSKVNIMAGATTPLATVIMSLTILAAIRLFLPLLYYLPECVLSLSTTIIGITVLEEVPHELAFFWNIGGYDEILTLAVVFCTTIFGSVQAGVVLGIIIAIVRVIKQGTRSRIHILGRVPNTSVFRNADELIEESFTSHVENHTSSSKAGEDLADFIAEIQQIEGVLIIKIPEPLNFANLGDLRNKLTRIEKFGSLSVHPSQPSLRGFDSGAIKLIVFDCKGMDTIDTSATQALYEIVKRYSEVNNICVCFARVGMEAQLRDRLDRLGLAKIVNRNYARFHRNRSMFFLDPADSPRSVNVSSRLGDGFFLSIDEALKAFDLDTV